MNDQVVALPSSGRCPPIDLDVDELTRATRAYVRAGAPLADRERRRRAAGWLLPRVVFIAEKLARGRFIFDAPRRSVTREGREVFASSPLQAVVLSALARRFRPSPLAAAALDASYGFLPRGRGPERALSWAMHTVRFAAADDGCAAVALRDVRNAFGSIHATVALARAAQLGFPTDVLGACAAFLGRFCGAYSRNALAPGAAISSPLADVALTLLDARLRRRGVEIVRYADNVFAVFEGEVSAAEADAAIRAAVNDLNSTSGMSLALHGEQFASYRVGVGFERPLSWLGIQFDGSAATLTPARRARYEAEILSSLARGAPMDVVEARIASFARYGRPVISPPAQAALTAALMAVAQTQQKRLSEGRWAPTSRAATE